MAENEIKAMRGVPLHVLSMEWLDRILAKYTANLCENKAAPTRKLRINVVLGADDLLGLRLGCLLLSSANRWRCPWWRK